MGREEDSEEERLVGGVGGAEVVGEGRGDFC